MIREVFLDTPSRLDQRDGKWWLVTIVEIDGKEVHAYSPVGTGEYLIEQVIDKLAKPALRATRSASRSVAPVDVDRH